ncbi:winged helix-turn-helix domain-containing protein [Nanoarchaeota archaeon]
MDISGILIVKALSSEMDLELTILQISKRIKKSYGYTHMHVKKLAKEGIIKSKEIGGSIICRLNFQSDITIGMLVLISMDKKSKSDLRLERYDYYKYQIVFLVDDVEYIFEKPSEMFKDVIANIDFNKLLIVHGHEMFWKFIGEVVE